MLRVETRPLDALIAAVAAAARGADPCHAVAAALGAHAAAPGLLDGIVLPEHPEHYCRHLLHEDSAGGWAVAALVWRPGQMSPVHAHRAWCAVGVHRGVLVESFYEAGETLVPRAVHLRPPGAISAAPADPRLIHRLANLGCETAVSIHAYGLAFDRFCSDLNTIHGR